MQYELYCFLTCLWCLLLINFVCVLSVLTFFDVKFVFCFQTLVLEVWTIVWPYGPCNFERLVCCLPPILIKNWDLCWSLWNIHNFWHHSDTWILSRLWKINWNNLSNCTQLFLLKKISKLAHLLQSEHYKKGLVLLRWRQNDMLFATGHLGSFWWLGYTKIIANRRQPMI